MWVLAVSDAAWAVIVALATAAGAAVGGLIAARVTYVVARQELLAAEERWIRERSAAEERWIRDTRRDVYDRFLTKAQDLQATCQIHAGSVTKHQETLSSRPLGISFTCTPSCR